MSKQISIDKIVNATLSGIINSQKQYDKWSGGIWLFNAPEYIITMNVAKRISEVNGPKFITLENNSSDALSDAGVRGRGRLPRDIIKKGRVDIILWWGNDTPRAAIEIKKYIYDFTKYEKDIKRIKQYLLREYQFGILAYFDWAEDGRHKSATIKIDDKILRLKSSIITILGKGFLVSSKRSTIYKTQYGNWCASCILIRKNTT